MQHASDKIELSRSNKLDGYLLCFYFRNVIPAIKAPVNLDNGRILLDVVFECVGYLNLHLRKAIEE